MTATAEPIRAERITKRFGGVLALRDVDCSARAGAITGLVGPNGSGKSTLLNVLGGHLASNGGAVMVDGRRVRRSTPQAMVRAGVVRLFQHPRVAIELSPLDNVAAGAWARDGNRHPLSRRSIIRMREMARSAAAEVGIESLLARPTVQLTHVELRLIEFARMLVAQPRIVLLDEPMAGLDRDERVRITELVRGLAAAGAAILLVEHDLSVIRELATRCFCLVNGTVIAQGSTRSVLADPNVIASYVGTADVA